MLEGRAVDLDACREMGVAIFAREAEGRLESLIIDVAVGRLAPIYNYLKDLPSMEGMPVPFLPKRYIKRTLGSSASFDAGRGCPYQCSFCTIINVQGRKSRHRSADDVEHLVRLNWAQGIQKFFITDDNFARNKEWESTFDRLIELRERDGTLADVSSGRKGTARSSPAAYCIPPSTSASKLRTASRSHAPYRPTNLSDHEKLTKYYSGSDAAPKQSTTSDE
jgi:hypothetical protein